MPRVGRTIRTELFKQAFQQRLGIIPIQRLRSGVVHAGQRKLYEQRFMHCPPVTVLPYTKGVERRNDFVACHGQYFALPGMTHRTPQRGSGKSPS